MKRPAALVLAVLLCWCALCQAALAQDSQDSQNSGPVDSGRLLVRLRWSSSLCFYDSGHFFRFGRDGGMELLPRLPETADCQTGAGTVYKCPIRWDDPETSVPGIIDRLNGTLEPEPGYILTDKIFLQPSILLIRLPGAGPLPVGELRDSLYLGQPSPVGQPLQKADLPAVVSAKFSGSVRAYVDIPVQWDWSGVDTSKTGLYSVPCVSARPDLFTIEAPLFYSVVVMEDDRIDLSCLAGRERMHNLVFRWLWQAPDLQKIRLYCAVDGGPWILDPPSTARSRSLGEVKCQSGLFTYGADRLTVKTNLLTPGKKYEIQLAYEGQFSNVLVITAGSSGQLGHQIDGDRGGLDRNEQTLPPVAQPPPVPAGDFDSLTGGGSDGDALENRPSEGVLLTGGGDASGSLPEQIPAFAPAEPPPAAPENSAPLERVTGTATILSGARVAEMTAVNPAAVLFEKDGVAVELPSSFLEALGLGSDALLEAVIEQPEPGSFRLELTADGIPLSALPPTKVRLPYEPAGNGPLACYDAQGGFVCDAVYHSAAGVVSVEITRTGTYTVREQADPADGVEAPPAKPMGRRPSAAVTAAACIAAAAFCAGLLRLARRRRHD